MREARQIKNICFSSVLLLQINSKSKRSVNFILIMKWMGIMNYSMLTDTVISPELSDSTACQSYPACIYCELSPQSWRHKYFHQSHLMVLVVWIAGKITDWMSGKWYNEGFGSNLVMRQVQTKLFVGTEASQEDILQVYQRSSQIFSSFRHWNSRWRHFSSALLDLPESTRVEEW